MAEQRRADYASTRDRALGAWVAAVAEGSPAGEASPAELRRELVKFFVF